ncbi:MAG: MBL fold metallo-hydrolase [Candidatus Palauibacterales bacterium]|nr:MBL fold metallo-hydrolase [Candidatus Palauibacterales bacterium]
MTAIPRRDFLAGASSCAAHLALLGLVAPRPWRWVRRAAPQGAVVAREPFGYLERVGERIWALVSTPLDGARQTVANGGLIAGRDGVLAIEGFYQPEGARWLAARARDLTGQWPTHVAITHYHADHANGVAGYVEDERHPAVRTTDTTRDLVVERNRPDAGTLAVLRDVQVLSPDEETVLDLGGRVVRVLPHEGHTASDVALVVDEQDILFCGDLVWHGMFPNYVDALPSRLKAAVAAIRRGPDTIYVPGHGPVGRSADFDRYAAMIDVVEQEARRAHAAGRTPAEAAATFTLPPALGEWTLFGPTFFERAFTAWYREFDT